MRKTKAQNINNTQLNQMSSTDCEHGMLTVVRVVSKNERKKEKETDHGHRVAADFKTRELIDSWINTG